MSVIGFLDRLEEIDRFFDDEFQLHCALPNLASRLKQMGIAYAIAGNLAGYAHCPLWAPPDNYLPWGPSDGIKVLMRLKEYESFQKEFGATYERIPNKRFWLMDRENGVRIAVWPSGYHVGLCCPAPEPERVSIEVEGIRVVALAPLIQLKLADWRHRSLADVIAMIRYHDLNESFADRVAPDFRDRFLYCVEERRREDECDIG